MNILIITGDRLDKGDLWVFDNSLRTIGIKIGAASTGWHCVGLFCYVTDYIQTNTYNLIDSMRVFWDYR